MQSSLDRKETFKKGSCNDCKMCQNCSESRCRLCRNMKCETRNSKFSFGEQIRLYNQLNPSISGGSE